MTSLAGRDVNGAVRDPIRTVRKPVPVLRTTSVLLVLDPSRTEPNAIGLSASVATGTVGCPSVGGVVGALDSGVGSSGIGLPSTEERAAATSRRGVVTCVRG